MRDLPSVKLFHFSEDPAIGEFVPRGVVAVRPLGWEWLNSPLVWAIDENHHWMYLFPRDCPRILLWATEETNQADVDRWLGGNRHAVIAYVERAWLDRLRSVVLSRYEFPTETFETLQDAGMWVSRVSVTPLQQVTITDLPARLADSGVDLRAVDSLVPFRDVWNSTLHASGIRLRNAQGWTS